MFKDKHLTCLCRLENYGSGLISSLDCHGSSINQSDLKHEQLFSHFLPVTKNLSTFILFGWNQLQLKEKHSWACENVDGSVERKEDF